MIASSALLAQQIPAFGAPPSVTQMAVFIACLAAVGVIVKLGLGIAVDAKKLREKPPAPAAAPLPLPQPFAVVANEPISVRTAVEFATLTQLAEHRKQTEEQLGRVEVYVHKGVHALKEDLGGIAARAQEDRESIEEKFGDLAKSVTSLEAAVKHSDILAGEVRDLNKSVSGLQTAVKYNDALATEVRGQLSVILQRLPRTNGGQG